MISFSNFFISDSTILVQLSSRRTAEDLVRFQILSPSSSLCSFISLLTLSSLSLSRCSKVSPPRMQYPKTRARSPMWEKRKVRALLTAVRHLDRKEVSCSCSSVVMVPVHSDLASEEQTLNFLSLFFTQRFSTRTISTFNKLIVLYTRIWRIENYSRHVGSERLMICKIGSLCLNWII